MEQLIHSNIYQSLTFKETIMKFYKTKLYLILAGVVLLLVGGFIGLMPQEYMGKFEVTAYQQDLMSELRGMGGSLFIFGTFVLLGGIVKQIETTALSVATLMYSAFSIFRFIGIIVDGLPSEGILVALAIEVIFAAFGLALIKSKTPSIETNVKHCSV